MLSESLILKFCVYRASVGLGHVPVQEADVCLQAQAQESPNCYFTHDCPREMAKFHHNLHFYLFQDHYLLKYLTILNSNF